MAGDFPSRPEHVLRGERRDTPWRIPMVKVDVTGC
jgi:hypothetical protein